MTRTDYEIVTRTGAVRGTYEDRKLAIDRAKALSLALTIEGEPPPGIRVVKVVRTEARYPVWSESVQLVEAAR